MKMKKGLFAFGVLSLIAMCFGFIFNFAPNLTKTAKAASDLVLEDAKYFYADQEGQLWLSDAAQADINTYASSNIKMHIPASVGGYQVKIILRDLFEGHASRVTELTLPDSIEIIQHGAFEDLKITSLTLGPNVKYIGAEGLLPKTTVDPASVFKGLPEDFTLKISELNPYYEMRMRTSSPSSTANNINIVTKAEVKDYSGANRLYPNNCLVTSIKPQRAIIPDVETIGTHAFDGITFTNTVFIPTTLTSIQTDAFTNCNFQQIVFNSQSLNSTSGSFIFTGFTNCHAELIYLRNEASDIWLSIDVDNICVKDLTNWQNLMVKLPSSYQEILSFPETVTVYKKIDPQSETKSWFFIYNAKELKYYKSSAISEFSRIDSPDTIFADIEKEFSDSDTTGYETQYGFQETSYTNLWGYVNVPYSRDNFVAALSTVGNNGILNLYPYKKFDAKITVQTDSFKYNGLPQAPYITDIKLGETQVQRDDYYVDELNAVNAGSYNLNVYGRGEYSGLVQVPFTITKGQYDMNGVSWNYDGPYTYDKQLHTLTLNGLPSGVTASYTDNSFRDAGTYTAKATFIYDSENYDLTNNNYADQQWEIKQATISLAGVTWTASDFTYNGDSQEVHLTPNPADITFDYSTGVNSATDAGTYTAKVTYVYDTRNFKLENDNVVKEHTWTIKKYNLDMQNVAWGFASNVKVQEGSAVFDNSIITITLTNLPRLVKNGTLLVTYTGNAERNAGEHSATATINLDTTNYALINADHLSLTEGYQTTHAWTIIAATIDLSKASWQAVGTQIGKPIVYDAREHSVVIIGLPSYVAIRYTHASATNAGTYTAKAEVQSSSNYITTGEIKDLTWEIQKATFNLLQVRWTWTDLTNYVYDGHAKTVELLNLPEGLTPVYTNCSAVNAGTYEGSVKFNYDANNYEAPIYEFTTITWTINKATIDMRQVIWNYVTPVYISVQPRLRNLPQQITATYSDIRYVEGEDTASIDVTLQYDKTNYKLENCSLIKAEGSDDTYTLTYRILQEEPEKSPVTVYIILGSVGGLLLLGLVLFIIRRIKRKRRA